MIGSLKRIYHAKRQELGSESFTGLVDGQKQGGGGISKIGSASVGGFQDTQTWTVQRTLTSGSNKVLVASIVWYSGAGRALTSVTWDTTETFTIVDQYANGTGDELVAIAVLTNPTVKTANIVATFETGAVYATGAVLEFDGVNQTTPTHGGGSHAYGESTTPTVDVSSVLSGEWTIDACYTELDPTSNTTAFFETQISDWDSRGNGSYDDTSTGTVTMSYTQSSDGWVITALALQVA